MATYRGFVFKDTGRILDLPGPERYWGNDVHNEYRGIMEREGLGDFVGNWQDNSKVKYFQAGGRAAAEAYSNKIKTDKVFGEEAKLGVDPKAVTPSERMDNYNKALAAYSSKIKDGKLSGIENDLLDKYKSAAIVASPKNIVDAANNYSIAFSLARIKGIENAGGSVSDDLSKYAQQIRGFDSKNLSADDKLIVQYVGDVQDAIDAVENQKKLVATQRKRANSLEGKQKEDARNRLFVEQDALQRLQNTSNQRASKVSEALGKVGLAETSGISTTEDPRFAKLSTGLSSLEASSAFQTGDLAYKLNSQVTNEQIINDINTAKKNQYKQLYDIGTQAATDLSSKIAKAKELLPGIAKSEQASAKTKIAELETQLTKVNSDIVKANNLYTNYQPISSAESASVIAKFRDSLRLPEQRTIDQINEIDPTIGAAVKAMSEKYQAMVQTPLGATTTPQTEAFRSRLEKGFSDYSTSGIGATQDAQTEAYRAQIQKQIQDYSLGKIGATTTPEAEALRRQVEGETAAQLALGSRLGAEEQRQYQQYSRGAQAARGNIFGVAPAVEEAVTTGAAGEARKQARYGAASQFLSSGQTTSDALARDTQLREALQQGRYQTGGAMLTSGQTVSDAMARDTQLRQALQQAKLGAGAQFIASGETTGAATARDLGLRNALEQSRLGAAQSFVAGGPTMYNLASQRLGTQQALLNNYLATSQPQTTGTFQGTSSTANPYAYVNPNAGFVGAQNAANIYNTLADYASQTYGARVGALSRAETGSQAFGNIASGLGNLFSFSKSF